MKLARSILVGFLMCVAAWAQAAPYSSTAFERAKHLRHGINASEWFAQQRDYPTERLTTYTTPADMELIRQMGFDHVRLSVDPAVLACLDSKQGCPQSQYLDSIVDKCLALGLAVIIDVHPSGEFKHGIASEDIAVDRFLRLWSMTAAHYAGRDPEKVFFEVMNEPELHDAYRWAAIQQKAVAAIRAAAPKHTIIVAGARWSDIEDLIALEPIGDNNLIYNFHYYEPHIFTHQGATWGEFFWRDLSKIPYPATADAMQPLLAATTNDFERWRLTEFAQENWGPQRINAEMGFIAGWAKKRGVPITCNEFGVFRPFSTPEARMAWLRDVRAA